MMLTKQILVRFPLVLIGITLCSFIYVYLCMINPILYLNILIWIVFGTLIFFSIQFLSIQHRIWKLCIGLFLSFFALYVSYGIEITLFYQSIAREVNGEVQSGSISVAELKNTFFSFHEYMNRLRILLNYSNMTVSKIGRNEGISLDATWLNAIRIFECLGILIIPVIRLFESRELYSAKPKSVEGICIHCKKTCELTHDQRKDIIHYHCTACGTYSF